MGYNWEEIRAKYESGQYTIKQLADEYGFNPDYGYQKSSNDNWIKGRLADRLRKSAMDYFYDSLQEEAEKIASIKYEYGLYVEWIKEALMKQIFKIPLNDDGSINTDEAPRLREPDSETLDMLHKALKMLKESKEIDWSVFNVSEAPQKLEVKHSGKIKGDSKYDESLIEKIATNPEYRELAEELLDIERGESQD